MAVQKFSPWHLVDVEGEFFITCLASFCVSWFVVVYSLFLHAFGGVNRCGNKNGASGMLRGADEHARGRADGCVL
ncbi:hypothetical protein FKW15_13150 [Acetobacter sp. DmW_125133]|uniref:Transmembrane protein n=3 Tax=Acetobacter TaxID=434 RepID=F1YUK2_9PROT|nr:hypothetical protein WG31_00575 [Acetobacter oryzifermentans]ATI12184.1 hypothetical protein CPF11_06755 [Acetobacter pomorum]AXC25455.1 hypothetical protein DS739_00670 [Acetobacter sp. JWB]EGE47641.1 Hypothetical protein APO_1625 [Acetobacter pomorum DM001]KAA8388069.1 hypothetical protein FKW31_02660 [Acetobacter sp. DmW_136]KAA8394447.1 hypothetical protein FKW20_13460 [Acetobacter sp. DmW_125127]KAA8397589.1 hypothetical protein FKW19_05870 [Acetobacter sp. DmW_125128]KAA8399246.1 hy